MKKPEVSILVVTYNSEKFLNRLLTSIDNLSYASFEVIIIDNASSDKTKKTVRSWVSKTSCSVQLVCNDHNIGFAAANNQAAVLASAKYLFFLNPDTELDKRCIAPMVEVFEKRTKLGIVQPAVYLPNSNTYNLTGKEVHFAGFDWLRDYQVAKKVASGSVLSASGSAMMMPKKLFVELGGFDSTYFMYYEDSDLSWRIRKAGYQIWFCSESSVYHDYRFEPSPEHQSLSKKFYYYERNRLVTILKHYSIKSLVVLAPALVFLELSLLVYAMLRGLVFAKVKSYVSLISLLPHIIRYRKSDDSSISDALITKEYKSALSFALFDVPIVRYAINPLLSGYWAIAKLVI